MLFYVLSRYGSSCLGLACYSISYHSLAVSAKAWHANLKLKEQSRTAKAQAPKTRATKAQVEQAKTCRPKCLGGSRSRKWQRILDWPAWQICKKNSCQKISKNNLVFAAPTRTGIRIDFTSMIEPYRWCPCSVTWDSSRTVVAIKLRRTSALHM